MLQYVLLAGGGNYPTPARARIREGPVRDGAQERGKEERGTQAVRTSGKEHAVGRGIGSGQVEAKDEDRGGGSTGTGGHRGGGGMPHAAGRVHQ